MLYGMRDVIRVAAGRHNWEVKVAKRRMTYREVAAGNDAAAVCFRCHGQTRTGVRAAGPAAQSDRTVVTKACDQLAILAAVISTAERYCLSSERRDRECRRIEGPRTCQIQSKIRSVRDNNLPSHAIRLTMNLAEIGKCAQGVEGACERWVWRGTTKEENGRIPNTVGRTTAGNCRGADGRSGGVANAAVYPFPSHCVARIDKAYVSAALIVSKSEPLIAANVDGMVGLRRHERRESNDEQAGGKVARQGLS